MSTERTSVRIAKEIARVEVARELGKAICAADLTQQDVADECGVPAQVVSTWCHRDGNKSPRIADAALMPTEVAAPLIRWLAAKHEYTLVAQREDAPLDARTLHAVLREQSEVALRLSDAIADGHLSPAELEAVEREANDVVDLLSRVASAARKLRQPVRLADKKSG